MVNKKGGKKYKKAKTSNENVERPLEFKTDGLEYCQVVKLLGNCRLEGQCFDGKTRLCKIRGTMTKRKKVWISPGDLVLVSLRDYEDGKCDVVHKYSVKEARSLKKLGEIPNSVKINEAIDENENEEEDIGIDFNEEDSEKEDKMNEDFKKNFEEEFDAI